MAFSARRAVSLALALLALTVLAGWFAESHFELTTNTQALISPNVDWRHNETAVNEAFPQQTNTMLVVIDGWTPELAEQATQRLTDALVADKVHFKGAKRPDGGAWLDRHGAMFGSVAEVRATTQALIQAQPLLGPLAADPSLRGIVGALGTILTGVENGAARLDDIDRPMVDLNEALMRIERGQPAYFSWQRLFADKGGLAPPTRRLVLAEPVLDYSSLEPGDAAKAALEKATRALGIDKAHGLRVQITGEVPLNDEEFASLKGNIDIVALVMAAAMLAALWFATKSVKLVIAIVATILAGLVIATATGLAAVGTLNLISVAFIPLFVGLGVDFGIQVAVRYNHERCEGLSVPLALEEAAAALGAPLSLAAGAVFLGFGAFLPTAYVGIAELGIIAGLGMIIALALSITLLPALIVLLKPARPAREVGFARAAPLDRFLVRHRRGVLWAFGLSMLVSIALLPLVQFDFNPLHLRDPDGPAMRSLNDLMHDPLRTPNTVLVLAANADAARDIANRAGELPEVAQAVSLDSYIPDHQDEKLALIQDASLLLDLTLNPFTVAPEPSDAENIAALSAARDRLARVGAAAGGRVGAHAMALATTLGKLAEGPPRRRARATQVLVSPLMVMLDQARAVLQAEPVTRDNLPPEIAEDWIAKDGHARVQIFPRGNSNDNDVLMRFTAAVADIAPNATGLPVATQQAAHTVAFAFVQAGTIALALISVLLWLVLRNVREVAFTLAPVVLSGFLTLGTCVVIGQPINFANIIAFPLLFGVGVAFHIYFVMAWRNGATDLLQSSLARAVLFSALATGTAFGALWLSHHPGTASMGKILMLSLAWTLVCALIFEPALLGPPREAGVSRKMPRWFPRRAAAVAAKADPSA